MAEPFIPELKKPGDLIRSTDWNRAMLDIKDLRESKLDRAGPATHQGPLVIQSDLEVGGQLTLGGAPVGAERGFGARRDVEVNQPQTATTDGLVTASIQAGFDASGTLAGESPVGQTRLSVAVPVAPAVTYVNDRAPRLSPDVGAPNDMVGTAVALAGDVAVVGAPFTDADNLTDSGCAYVYVRQDGKWVRQARLLANDRAAKDNFGAAVAISGDTILIGAPGKGSVATQLVNNVQVPKYTGVGAGYIFVRQGQDWVQQKTLRWASADDATAADAHSGAAVALAGDVAVLGAPDWQQSKGVVTTFIRKSGDWSPPTGNTFWPANSGVRWYFGAALALSGDTLLIGTPLGDLGTYGIFVYCVRKGEKWELQGEQLCPAERWNEGWFGKAVALEGDTALIGMPTKFDGTNFGSSNGGKGAAAYIFERKGGVWMEKAKLVPRDSEAGDRFGASVALSGKYALIGAPGKNSRGDRTGAVYVFGLRGGKWVELAKWVPGDGATDDNFGAAVALVGDTAFFSAPKGRNETGVGCGTVYGSSPLPAPRAGGFTMDVRKGDTWMARLTNDSGACAAKVQWSPIDSSKKS